MNLPDHPSEVAGQDSRRLVLLGHDLRAAVSDVLGGLRLIDQSALNDEARLQFERVRASGETLARLLEEGLSLMLGADEFVSTHPGNIQIARFLYDLEMRWSGRATEKGLGFTLTTGAGLPEIVALDKVALERALSNILSNALKYTDAGGVSLDVSLSPAGALCFAVQDQGPGFSDAALERLFQYRGRPDGATKPGDGLGMHITKELTGRLGGAVAVENRAEGGARVTLELPPESWTLGDANPSDELPDLGELKVLVAEDNPTNQTIISHMLARLNADCVMAEDGAEALRWLERERFDVALIDIEMPRVSGIEVIRALRNGVGDQGRIPIVAVTAYVLRANRDAIYAAGADAILAKPLAGVETFGQVIAGAIERRWEAAPAAAEPIDTAEINRETFEHLLSIAGPVAMRELLDRLSGDLRKAERGLIAGIADGDRTQVRAETHVLIALAGAVGAERLHALAQALNALAHRRDSEGMAALGADALAGLDRLIHFIETERARRAGSG